MFIARLIGTWFLASGVFGSVWAALGLAASRRAASARAERLAKRQAIVAVDDDGTVSTSGVHGADRLNDLEAVRRRSRFRVIPGGGEAVPA